MIACFGTFAAFDFAAGEFPKSGERFALWPALREEHGDARVDQGASRNQQEAGCPAFNSGTIR